MALCSHAISLPPYAAPGPSTPATDDDIILSHHSRNHSNLIYPSLLLSKQVRKYSDALRMALRMDDRELAEATFAKCEEPGARAGEGRSPGLVAGEPGRSRGPRLGRAC
jgi:hypothetical protein